MIYLYRKQMYESEAQHRSAQIKHLLMLDALLDLHYLRTVVCHLKAPIFISCALTMIKLI